MDLAKKLPKIKDQEKESNFGYVFAVSGPGEWGRHQILKPRQLIKYAAQFLNLSLLYIVMFCSP